MTCAIAKLDLAAAAALPRTFTATCTTLDDLHDSAAAPLRTCTTTCTTMNDSDSAAAPPWTCAICAMARACCTA